MRRRVWPAVAVLVLTTVPVSAAWADPAGPTDYRSEIVSVEPPPSGVHIRMIGGDSFLEVSVDRGIELEVVGYRGEPYLRFGPDGAVEINDNAPSTYLNEDRYGETDVPPSASADVDPSWRVVSEDGVHAWHDHRTHWMNQSRPAGEPGAQILEANVPLVVNGIDTDVTVISTWEPPPSPWSASAGAVIGAAIALVASRIGGCTARSCCWCCPGLRSRSLSSPTDRSRRRPHPRRSR